MTRFCRCLFYEIIELDFETHNGLQVAKTFPVAPLPLCYATCVKIIWPTVINCLSVSLKSSGSRACPSIMLSCFFNFLAV